MKISLPLFVVFLLSVQPLAATESAEGIVQYTGTFNSGRFFIQIDSMVLEPGCQGDRVDIAPGHPEIKNWLSMAMVSATTKTPIVIRTNGCYAGHPTIDASSSTSGWIFIKTDN